MAHSVTLVRLKRQLRLANRENFSKVPLIGLAGILALAFVRGKLKPKSFLRVPQPSSWRS
jgi:hypothetical protein